MVRHSSSSTTSSGRAELFKLVNEVDTGGLTSNPYILAQRCIDSGLMPTAAIINEIQGTTGTSSAITDAHVALFLQGFKDRLALQGTLATASSNLVSALGLPNQGAKCTVIYVVTRQRADGGLDVYVGSSYAGPLRLKTQSKAGKVSTLTQQVAVHGNTAFKVDIMVVPEIMEDKLAFQLAFEQWAILYMFGVLKATPINKLLVAGSGLRAYNIEEIQLMRERTGTKVYVYEAGTLIFVFLAVKELVKDTVISRGNAAGLLGGSGQVGGLTVTQTPIPGAPQALMSKVSFIPYFNDVALKASDFTVAMLRSGHSSYTQATATPGTGTVIGVVGPVPTTRLTAIYIKDPSLTFTGAPREVADWMQSVDGTGTSKGVRTAYNRKQQRYQAYKLTYPSPSP